jgi:hypothetical protein
VDTLGQSNRHSYSNDHRWFKIGFGANGSVTPLLEANTIGGANRYGMDYYVRSVINSCQELASTTHYLTGQSTHLNNSKIVKLTDGNTSSIWLCALSRLRKRCTRHVIRVGKRFAYGNAVNNTESSKYYLNDVAYQQIASYLSN